MALRNAIVGIVRSGDIIIGTDTGDMAVTLNTETEL